MWSQLQLRHRILRPDARGACICPCIPWIQVRSYENRRCPETRTKCVLKQQEKDSRKEAKRRKELSKSSKSRTHPTSTSRLKHRQTESHMSTRTFARHYSYAPVRITHTHIAHPALCLSCSNITNTNKVETTPAYNCISVLTTTPTTIAAASPAQAAASPTTSEEQQQDNNKNIRKNSSCNCFNEGRELSSRLSPSGIRVNKRRREE